jgi:hypothetical protein
MQRNAAQCNATQRNEMHRIRIDTVRPIVCVCWENCVNCVCPKPLTTASNLKDTA